MKAEPEPASVGPVASKRGRPFLTTQLVDNITRAFDPETQASREEARNAQRAQAVMLEILSSQIRDLTTQVSTLQDRVTTHARRADCAENEICMWQLFTRCDKPFQTPPRSYPNPFPPGSAGNLQYSNTTSMHSFGPPSMNITTMETPSRPQLPSTGPSFSAPSLPVPLISRPPVRSPSPVFTPPQSRSPTLLSDFTSISASASSASRSMPIQASLSTVVQHPVPDTQHYVITVTPRRRRIQNEVATGEEVNNSNLSDN